MPRTPTKPIVGFLMENVLDYDQRHIVARPVALYPSIDRLRTFDRYDRPHVGTAVDLADFQIRCYLGSRHGDPDELWGFAYGYREPIDVDLDRAEGMVKVLRKLRVGVSRLEDQHGYVRSGDFTTYLTRVASVLKIGVFYSELPHPELYPTTGKPYRAMNGVQVQHWVRDQQEKQLRQRAAA